MGIPFATTTVKVQRFSTSSPGTLTTVTATQPAVVGKISGKEIWAYRGIAEAGWREDLTSKLNTDFMGVEYGDIVTDLGTGIQYRAVWATPRQGLGLDHMESGLSLYQPTGLYSCFRGTTTDSFNDVVPNTSVAPSAASWAAIPGEIREVTRDRQEDGTMQPGTVRVLAGRFPTGLDIRPQDRIRNDTSGVSYTVLNVGLITEAGNADVGVELKKITN